MLKIFSFFQIKTKLFYFSVLQYNVMYYIEQTYYTHRVRNVMTSSAFFKTILSPDKLF